MKKLFYGLLFCTAVYGLSSCSNGDYQASPSSNANAAVNPITPLTEDEFSWSGDEPLSADINGSRWVADYASFALDSSGGNVIIGYKEGSRYIMRFYLKDVWTNNLYSMEWKDYNRFAYVTDSETLFTDGAYFSYLSNSGGVSIIQNDSAVIKGKFYFKGVSANGNVMTINNGYFKIDKPL